MAAMYTGNTLDIIIMARLIVAISSFPHSHCCHHVAAMTMNAVTVAFYRSYNGACNDNGFSGKAPCTELVCTKEMLATEVDQLPPQASSFTDIVGDDDGSCDISFNKCL